MCVIIPNNINLYHIKLYTHYSAGLSLFPVSLALPVSLQSFIKLYWTLSRLCYLLAVSKKNLHSLFSSPHRRHSSSSDNFCNGSFLAWPDGGLGPFQCSGWCVCMFLATPSNDLFGSRSTPGGYKMSYNNIIRHMYTGSSTLLLNSIKFSFYSFPLCVGFS